MCLNVNVPRGKVLGVRVTRQSQKISRNIIREQKDPRGRPHYWLDETISRDEVEPDSDYGAILRTLSNLRHPRSRWTAPTIPVLTIFRVGYALWQTKKQPGISPDRSNGKAPHP